MTGQGSTEDVGMRYISGLASKEEFLAVRLSEVNLTDACKGIAGCEAFLKGKLRDGFWLLDQLDRNDPFWKDTNKLPTLYKLDAFSAYLMRAGTHLVDAAWIRIARNMECCGQHLDPEAWKVLQEQNSLDLPFLVRSAWNSERCWGDESITAFVALARSLQLARALEDELNGLAESSPESRKWVRAVRRELSPGAWMWRLLRRAHNKRAQ